MKQKDNKSKLPLFARLLIIGVLIEIICLAIAAFFEISTILTLIGMIGFLLQLAGFILLVRYLYNKAHTKITEKHETPQEVSYQAIKSTQYDNSNGTYQYNKNEYDLDNYGNPLSWFLPLMFLFTVFPLGIYLVLHKTIKEKKFYYRNGVKLQLFSIIPFALILFLLITLKGDIFNQSMLIVSISAIIDALFLIICGTVFRQKGKTIDKYMVVITKKQITNLREISKQTGDSYSNTIKNLQKLIDNDYLPGAYIDYKDDEIIVHGISKKIACKCNMCGGTTVLYYNDEKICGYCGAKL